MPVKFSLKSILLMLLGGLVCAGAFVFLAAFLFSGPRLGPHYDFLLGSMQSRQSPPVSREILIIETGEFLDSNDIFSVLMTLTEMDAANVIMTGKVEPSSSPVTITEAEIRRRFIDEYILVGSNIRNLFEGIRMGSVTPVQAPNYVERLVELTERGRDRLLAALIDRDENLLRSIAVFGNYTEVDIEPNFDRDGKLRRVKPIDTGIEHPVFVNLKNRYAVSQIETIDREQILWLRTHDGKEIDIPLDKNGNIITPWNCSFRRVPLSLFREYEEAQRSMRAALAFASELGAFSRTLPEQSPLFLGDYALELREEMLRTPPSVTEPDEKKLEWIYARENYFKSLEEFLYGQAQALLVNGYEEVIADEISLIEAGPLLDARLAALSEMRDNLIQSFDVMRHEYGALSALYARLKEELDSSYCIMGPDAASLSSALLANALITGSHITPANDRAVIFWSAAAAFAVVLVIFLLRPSILLLCGIVLSAVSSAVFGYVFVSYSYWIDPVIVLTASLFGTLFLFYCKCAIIRRRTLRFRSAYGTAVSEDVLKELIRQGKPRISDSIVTHAVVVAIKDINLLNREDREKPHDAGSLKKQFFSNVKKIVFASGAVIAGYEGDTILACFGSPLCSCHSPLVKAIEMVRELLADGKNSWRFGIDAGICTFCCSPETGYSVHGRPAVRARILSSKTARLKVRALITDVIRSRINTDVEKIDSLSKEPVYELPLQD